MNEFNVLIWNINSNKLETYNVLHYFREEYKALKKKDRPVTKEDWIKFVISKGKYMFWARCEWEILISPWPTNDKQVKIDVWKQIENNLELIVKLLMSEL